MKKVLIVLALVLAVAFAAPVNAKEKMASLGLSFNLPYTISPAKARGSFGMDLLGEYYINPNFALHMMFQFQFEAPKAMFIDPGVRYYFFTDKTWSPYVTLQVVLGLKNAATATTGGNFNYGFRVGPGVNFDLSEATGLEGLNTFFDVDFWGLLKSTGGNTRIWNIDIFRLGFAYAF